MPTRVCRGGFHDGFVFIVSAAGCALCCALILFESLVRFDRVESWAINTKVELHLPVYFFKL
jgi:hypothetical protein